MTLEGDLAVLAAAVADATAVRPGEVVLLLGAEDAGPTAVVLAAELARRGAVVRPWLGLAAAAHAASTAAAALTAGLAARADVVVGLGVTPPAGPTRSVEVAVPSHAGAQEAGCSLPDHARALAAAPIIARRGPSDG